jgi:hypothetical protein
LCNIQPVADHKISNKYSLAESIIVQQQHLMLGESLGALERWLLPNGMIARGKNEEIVE